MESSQSPLQRSGSEHLDNFNYSDNQNLPEPSHLHLQHRGPNELGIANYGGTQEIHESNLYFGAHSGRLDSKGVRSLSEPDYTSDKAEVEDPHEGTCQWVLNTDQYKQWYDKASTTLHIVGNPGVGKTVLAKFLFETLHQANQSKKRTIYFFCSRQKQNHSTALSILRALIHQCAMLAESCEKHVNAKYNGLGENLPKSFGNLCDVFATIMSDAQSGDWYCILDALDECDELERKRLLENIGKGIYAEEKDRKSQMSLKLLIISRPCKGISSKLSSHDVKTLHFADAQGKGVSENDLLKYVEDKVSKLADYSARAKTDIKQKLNANAEGSFKYASSMINYLENTPCEEVDLTNPSLREMNEMFQDLVEAGPQDLETFLKWVAVGYRAMSVAELRAAVKIRTTTPFPPWKAWKSQTAAADNTDVLRWGGALKIQEGKVYLVHSSMKEFLCSSPNLLANRLPEIHREIADACLSYLSNNDCLKRGPFEATRKEQCQENYEKLIDDFPFLKYAARYVRIISEFTPSFVPRALERTFTPEASQHFFYSHNAIVSERYMLTPKLQWYEHLQAADYSEGEAWSLARPSLCNGLKRALSFQIHQFSIREEYVGGQTCLHILAHHNLTVLVESCLKVVCIDPNAVDDKGRTALWWAATNNHESMVIKLLGNEMIDPNIKDRDDEMSPFVVAAKNGNVSMVEDFLQDKRIHQNSMDNKGRTALSWAAGEGHENMVKLLLRNGDIRDAIDLRDSLPDCHQTPLLWAAHHGHTQVVKLLLEKNADPNATDQQGLTAFHWAAAQENKITAEAILDQLRARSGNNWHSDRGTLLTQAATKGQDAALRLLLGRSDIEPDTPDHRGRTALSCAAERGHDKIVELLLGTAKANVNSTDNRGQTPLMWAAGADREGVVKLLLAKREIDLDARDYCHKTAAGWAEAGAYPNISALIRAKKMRDQANS